MEGEIFTKPLPQILDELKARIEDLEKICRSGENDLREVKKIEKE